MKPVATGKSPEMDVRAIEKRALVDVWAPVARQSISPWRKKCVVVDSSPEGEVDCRWQSRVLKVGPSHVRPHVAAIGFFAAHASSMESNPDLMALMKLTEHLPIVW